MLSVTERELLLLGDTLAIHATLAEKSGYYAGQATDPQVRQVLLQLQRGHQRHVEMVAQHINQASMGGIAAAAGTQEVYPYASQTTQSD